MVKLQLSILNIDHLGEGIDYPGAGRARKPSLMVMWEPETCAPTKAEGTQRGSRVTPKKKKKV